jgi:hypothetical protein
MPVGWDVLDDRIPPSNAGNLGIPRNLPQNVRLLQHFVTQALGEQGSKGVIQCDPDGPEKGCVISKRRGGEAWMSRIEAVQLFVK